MDGPTPTSAVLPAPRTILPNNLAALLLGSAVMVLLHEAVHWLTGAALGYRSILYSFGVTYPDVRAPGAIATTAISAPIFSLVSGFAMIAWQPLRRIGGFAHLLWLWLAFISAQEGVTYFVIAPFGAGDTATFVEAAGWPGWVTIPLCLAGVAGMFATAALFATCVVRHCSGEITAMRAMAWYPWLLSIPFVLATGFLYTALAAMRLTAGEFVIVMLAGLSMTVFAPMAFIFVRRTRPAPEPLALPPLPVAGIVGYAVMLVVNLLLTRGLAIGG